MIKMWDRYLTNKNLKYICLRVLSEMSPNGVKPESVINES